MVSTVDRVLPWLRHREPPAVEVKPVVDTFHRHHPKSDADRIVRAHRAAADAHDGQFRKSGDPYVTHPLAVAGIVADFGLDDVTVAAALLHDAVEDTSVTLDDVSRDFGDDVAMIVDGVTKLDRLEFESREEQQAATIRKMLVAMAEDLRVLVVKLADRLHNMRTLAAMGADKQQRTAQETLDIYAPLAHRLGMDDLKQQLQDLAFAAVHPRRYAEIDHMVDERAPERDLYLTQIMAAIQGDLDELDIDAEITGRPKHLWSIYEKMIVKGRQFDDIFDLVGIRIITDSVRDCYGALGAVHARWQPVPGRFKDYIATPKFNLYQSLHTTVVGPQNKSIEVQIRTEEMHQRAEMGVASHWAYKDPSAGDIEWLNRILDWQAETSDPSQFMDNLKGDLDQDEVYVFTPKGDVLTLPLGATAIDFAYTVHTEVGHACIGARVDGRLVPLDRALESGETVEILTSKGESAGPSRDWLNIVVTPRAANKIRHWFSRERREDYVSTGRDEVQAALRRAKLPVQNLSEGVVVEVAKDLNYADVDSLYAAVGEHHVTAKAVAARIGRALTDGDPDREEQLSTAVSAPRRRGRRSQSTPRVHVEGQDSMMVRLSRCCTPVPGDAILGFVTRGRGVTVHRTDCANGMSLAREHSERLIDVEWDADHPDLVVATIVIEALDREWLLRDVSTCLADHHLNVVNSATNVGPDRVARMEFDAELSDESQLGAVLASLKSLDAVFDAYRALPRGPSGDDEPEPGRG